MILPLEHFEDDARVLKPNATRMDFAFDRIGTVIREKVDGRVCLGVLWDGATSVFEYPGDILFESGQFEKGAEARWGEEMKATETWPEPKYMKIVTEDGIDYLYSRPDGSLRGLRIRPDTCQAITMKCNSVKSAWILRGDGDKHGLPLSSGVLSGERGELESAFPEISKLNGSLSGTLFLATYSN